MPKPLTPAERVERLRRQHGSHDKLAKALGVTRQRIIGWEQGKGISPKYAAALAKLAGTRPEAFRPAKVPPQFRSMRRDVRLLGEDVADLSGRLDRIVVALEQAGITVPRSR